MTKQGSEFYENFTKNIYETLKGLSDDDRGDYIIHTYENLYGKLKTEDNTSGVVVDMAKLREDLSHIRGIGGQRLDEIMSVIERHLTQGASPEPEIGRADGIPDDGENDENSGNDSK